MRLALKADILLCSLNPVRQVLIDSTLSTPITLCSDGLPVPRTLDVRGRKHWSTYMYICVEPRMIWQVWVAPGTPDGIVQAGYLSLPHLPAPSNLLVQVLYSRYWPSRPFHVLDVLLLT